MRGGARNGAGRKKGSVTKATAIRQEMLARAAADGISPLDVMLGAMREAWDSGNVTAAANFAKDAAPYMHPRLQAVEHKGNADHPLEQNSRVELVVIDATDDKSIRSPQAGAFAQTRPI